MTEQDTLDELVNFGGENMSMAMLGNIDMGSVEAVRYSNLPAGSYVFQTDEATRSIVEIVDKKNPQGDKIPVQVVFIKTIVAQCRALVKDSAGTDLEELKGKTHVERFFMADADGIGRFKAFMEDCLFKGTGTLDEVLVALKGHAFIANIAHRKNANDPDRPYANFDFPKDTKAA